MVHLLLIFLQFPEQLFAIFIYHPHKKINAPFKFYILFHKLLLPCFLFCGHSTGKFLASH